MARISCIGPRVASAPRRNLGSIDVADRRVRGRAGQSRRFRLWQASPYCACCGRIVAFPGGFEVDHIVPLFKGGEDADSNCQILCVEFDADGKKAGCHAAKTAEDLRR